MRRVSSLCNQICYYLVSSVRRPHRSEAPAPCEYPTSRNEISPTRKLVREYCLGIFIMLSAKRGRIVSTVGLFDYEVEVHSLGLTLSFAAPLNLILHLVNVLRGCHSPTVDASLLFIVVCQQKVVRSLLTSY